jgi:hypothetical protein
MSFIIANGIYFVKYASPDHINQIDGLSTASPMAANKKRGNAPPFSRLGSSPNKRIIEMRQTT